MTKGTNADITVTLQEGRTLDAGYYLFVFEGVTTKQVIKKSFSFLEDTSGYPDRYQLYTIPAALFTTATPQDFKYKVYEAETNTTDPEGLTLVEVGLMILKPATSFSYDSYDGATTFKAYAG